ncbi:MAG: Ig-like domain-containing protein [Thermomicrobiales bacterium]|nr:Ig-like domain-containing protein [Thermomicrobiales bacterium]
MSDCTMYREMISSLIDGTLEREDASRLRSHLAQCETCRATLEEYRRIGIAVRTLPPIMPPVELTDRILAQTVDAGPRRLYLVTNRVGYSLAAVAAVVVVFIVAAYLLIGGYQRGITPEVTASRPTTNETWPINSPIEITFNKAMDHASVSAALGIQPSGEDQRLSQAWDGNTLQLGLDQPLKPGSTYIIKITDAAQDRWGNHLASTYTLTFNTTSNIEAYRTPTPSISPTPSPIPSITPTEPLPTATGLAVVPEQPTDTPPQSTPAGVATAPPAAPTATASDGNVVHAPTATATPIATATSRPDDPTPTATPTSTPVPPTATATPSPTPVPPTATATTVPPTATATTPATIPVTGAIGDVYWANDSVQQRLGAALSASYTTDGLQQDFQQGTMLYRADRGAAYVLINNQLIWSTYSAAASSASAATGGPEDGLWVPGGLLGSVWNANESVQSDLGYALSPDAASFTATVQMFEHGLALVSPTSVYIFYDDGGWEFWPAGTS